MREVEVAPPAKRTGAKAFAGELRAQVCGLNVGSAKAHEVTRGSVPGVVYAPGARTHGNFVDASYRRILGNPAWAKRLEKAHTGKRQARAMGMDEEKRAWRELDTATSSDALLMNIFCYPRVWTAGLRALLGVSAGCEMEFGYRPKTPLVGGRVDRTEIDLRVGDLLIEAKLTESDFQFGAMRLVERYRDFEEVFERDALEVTGRGVRSYQLIRGVLAAHALGSRFCVLCDARRPDLVEAWYGVMRAVRSFELQGRLRMVTWQEVAGCVPVGLQRFLGEKYGIGA